MLKCYFGYIGLKYIIKVSFTFLLFKLWPLKSVKITSLAHICGSDYISVAQRCSTSSGSKLCSRNSKYAYIKQPFSLI